MSCRFHVNRTFVEKFVKEKASQRKKILERSTHEELMTIVECLLNIDNIPFSLEVDKCFRGKNSITKVFTKHNYTDLEESRSFFVKHNKEVAAVLGCVLRNILEMEICEILTA